MVQHEPVIRHRRDHAIRPVARVRTVEQAVCMEVQCAVVVVVCRTLEEDLASLSESDVSP